VTAFVDVHSHVVPSGDDGARSIEAGLGLCLEAARHGTRVLYATPHVWPSLTLTPEREEAVRVAHAEMAPALAEHGLDLRLGWELTPTERLLDEEPGRYRLGDLPAVLMEVPFHGSLGLAERLAEHVAGSGLTPIVAHPERAEHVREGLDAVAAFRERGWLIQINATSLLGAHGLELAPDADRWREEIHAFASGVDWPVEDKGLTVSFHYRQAEDEDAALEYLDEVAGQARRAGLIARFGRKVLEIRPPVHADKGTAVKQLLDEAGLRRALYAGDDSTDADGFRALDGLDVGFRVAVSSDEAPSELIRLADVVVASPAELLTLLARL